MRSPCPMTRQLRAHTDLREHLAHHELPAYDRAMIDNDTARAVMHLASERPEWIRVLRAACQSARKAEPYGGEFAGAWVVQELEQMEGQRIAVPNLRTLATYGLVVKSGESTRGGRRAYYRMPDRQAVESALQELERSS